MIQVFDMHTHTRFSPDSDASETELLKRAEKLGLRGVAITDHCECNVFYSEKYYSSYDESYRAILSLKKDFNSDSFTVLTGIELGQFNQNPKTGEKILEKYHFDYVLGALHNIIGFPDFYFVDFNRCDPVFFLSRYFEELEEICRLNFFDCLAHILYPFRYINSVYHKNIPLSDFYPQIDNVLKILIENKKALELNTSGVRKKTDDYSDTLEVLKRFSSLGGNRICLGSDAHYPEQAGMDFKQALTDLKALGFTKLCRFKDRKIQFQEII